MILKKKLHLLVVGIFIAALVSACGDNTATPVPATTTAAATTAAATTASAATTAAAATTASAATTAAATTAAATTAAAAASGTFRDRWASEPKTLDPGLITDEISIRYGQNIFQGLVEFDNNLQVVPAAAEALPTVSADGKTYTYKLKKGLKWSNGDALTMKDFVYGWNRVAQLGVLAQYAFIFSLIDGFDAVSTEKDDAKRQAATVSGIKLVDDYTATITLTDAASYFLTENALWAYWPVNQKAVESNGNKFDDKNTWSLDASKIVTNGPFIITDWKHDVSMAFAPNPNYVGDNKPKISKVTVDIIKEDATAKLKFDNGELDDTIVPVSDIQATKKDAKYKDSYHEFPQARISWLAFNMSGDNVFAKNLKLRQAFSYAIDRQLITDGALQGSALPSTILLPAGIPGAKQLDSYAFSADKAKQTLKDAGYDTADKVKALEDTINGYGGGKSGGIAFNNDSSAAKAWMENVQQQIKTNLGLSLNLNPVATFKEFLERRDTNHEFQGIYRGSWGADYPDAQNFYTALFQSKSGTNQSQYKSAAFDALVLKADLGKTPAERAEFYQQAEALLQADAAYIPNFSGIVVRLINPKLQGYGYNAQSPYQWKYMTIKP
ncbi:MAG: peptide ABC transporter substrate-binding protein [Chloroflexi bacterium]|uniref:Peptide ABC transporter substrate-binding protein n=1 Tax=Candidatus Chlorohelix allophototropha TaxID=3003348 RepID=A0A8T7M792_9CHLR|nr:peptide ABC transporter substrate-binding protein [Chloroflexota bacterium]WJW69920.1 peptide ABC transporter substrate-binding protein [Chloroflexota bacterium L227-S17]